MFLLNSILQKMSNVKKPQRTFLIILLTTLMYLPSKANFRNLSRYSDLHEKTYSRNFRKNFNFLEFNKTSLVDLTNNGHTWVFAIDCSFVPKAGDHTYGLDYFYNGANSRAEKGLELSTLALIDVDYNTAYHLSTRQTPQLDDPKETRVDWYLKHLIEDKHALPTSIRYGVLDGYYAKIKVINGFFEQNLHLISKLRHDANLRWLYNGPQKPRGRRKLYDGKVYFDKKLSDRFEYAGQVDGVQLYTSIVNNVHFKRNIRIVYLIKTVHGKTQTALLFSTDTQLSAHEIYRLYKARFQIEFLFRDAKQFTGLTDCQARCSSALNFHFNASMMALNLLKLEHRQQAKSTDRSVISIASLKIRKFNEHLLERFFSILGLDPSSIKSMPEFATLCNYGAITA
jgi:hypothetical protein